MDKEDNNLSVSSYNQSGGITAHTVSINQSAVPKWGLEPSTQMPDGLWRTKLWANCQGQLPAYNWSLLFTFNNEVIRREDVPGEVSVGPWMPLEVAGGTLPANSFFIGFSEFKPGQHLAIYLFSKQPLKALNVHSLS